MYRGSFKIRIIPITQTFRNPWLMMSVSSCCFVYPHYKHLVVLNSELRVSHTYELELHVVREFVNNYSHRDDEKNGQVRIRIMYGISGD